MTNIVKLLKLLEKEGYQILGADMQIMSNLEKDIYKSHNRSNEDYIIPYWNLKIQLPDDKK
jgi:hypothetical protein